MSQEPEKSFKRNIILADETESAISLTLWGKTAETELSVGTIVGLKRVKVTAYGGDKQINTFSTTEIVVNPQNKRIPILKKLIEDKSIFNHKVSYSKGGLKRTPIIRVFFILMQ